jgi:uncharacterized membrane protein
MNPISLAKAITYRILGTTVTAIISLIITRHLSYAAYIGAADFAIKLAGYYIHEEIWNKLTIIRIKTIKIPIQPTNKEKTHV